MPKRSEMNWYSTNMFSKLFLVSVLLQFSLGFDIFEEEKRQGLIPLARLGGARLLTALEDNKNSGSMIAYPRLGRRVFELHQTLIPYPRAGRLVVDPESLDYDIFLNADYGTTGLDDTFTDTFLNNDHVLQKRPSVKLIPRIGRKKRSVSEKHNEREDEVGNGNDEVLTTDGSGRPFWDDFDGIDEDYFYGTDKKSIRSKNAFVPRIGKKSDSMEGFENKRARAFTPRIGRASLIPRIGRNDPRFRLKSRGAFIPRIGRRAALIPRIGRSEHRQDKNEQSD